MIFRRPRVELTAAERRLYGALRQDVESDAGHEDRTVAALRAAGLLGAQAGAPPVARRHGTAMIAAAAALVVAVTGLSALVLHARRDANRVRHAAAEPRIAGADSAATKAAHSYLVWY